MATHKKETTKIGFHSQIGGLGRKALEWSLRSFCIGVFFFFLFFLYYERRGKKFTPT